MYGDNRTTKHSIFNDDLYPRREDVGDPATSEYLQRHTRPSERTIQGSRAKEFPPESGNGPVSLFTKILAFHPRAIVPRSEFAVRAAVPRHRAKPSDSQPYLSTSAFVNITNQPFSTPTCRQMPQPLPRASYPHIHPHF